MTSLEQNACKAFIVYAATATAFWRFRQFRILAPDEQQQDHYLEMQQLADQIYQSPDLLFEKFF